MQEQKKAKLRTARDSVNNSAGLMQINFLTILREQIEQLIAINNRKLELLKQEISLVENASLHIHHRGRQYHFSCYDNKTKERCGITEESDRVYKLARKGHIENLAKAIESNSSRLTKALEATEWAHHEIRVNRKLHRYTQANLDLSRIFFTKEQNEWIDHSYTPNPFHPENLLYSTSSGILMRSKSEAIIGNYFETIGIPYRSDDLIVIHNGSAGERPFRDNYFADFKVPNLLGGITIHEHFGAFQIDKYANHALKRLNDYRSFQIFELPYRPVAAEEFTWSLEADLQDEGLFHRLIQKILFPL